MHTANMKHKYRLVAVDMDGTLLRRNKTVGEKTIHAVNSSLEQGIHIVIATGRSRVQCERYLELFPKMQYVITSSGAAVYELQHGWNKIISNEIQPSQALEILKYAESVDCFPIMSVEGKSVYTLQMAPHASEYGLGAYVHEINAYGTGVDSVYRWFTENLQPVESISLYFRSRALCDDAVSVLRHLPLYFALPGEPAVEISAETANKGHALKLLCDRLGISLENVIAIGDSDNDVPMLRAAGYAVAAANGQAAVREMADYVTADCDHDGVAEVLKNFL